MNLPVAILAGGLATRLRPITEKIPKSLVDVGGKPFIDRQLELLARNGAQSVVLCVGHLGYMVEEVVGDGSRWGLSVRYSADGDRLLGTGGALKRALPLLGDAFFVLYGDSYLDCDYGAVEDAFRASRKTGLMTVLRNANRWDRSNVLYRQGQLIVYDKTSPSREMEHIDYGLGVLSAAALKPYHADAPLDLAQVYADLLRAHELAAFEVTRRFYEIGSPEGLEETRALFAQKGAVG